MGEIEPDENLDNITLDVFERQFRPESSEVSVFDVLKDQGRRPGAWVCDLVVHVDDVGAALEGLQDFDLAPDFELLHWLEDFDHHILIG